MYVVKAGKSLVCRGRLATRNARTDPRAMGSKDIVLIIPPFVDVVSKTGMVALTPRTASNSKRRLRRAPQRVRMRTPASHRLNRMSMYDARVEYKDEKAISCL
jgi:hypothetical protein